MVSKEKKKEGREGGRKVEEGREEREKGEMNKSIFGMASWPCYYTGVFLVLSN